ncbi:MAG: hypothetical protein GC188_11825 [Alphaproteobacteria bacterium]|nr:hypothetical protein [Alphaproteobacteria bacterium]
MAMTGNRPALVMCAPDALGDRLQSFIADRCRLFRISNNSTSRELGQMIRDGSAAGALLAAHQVGRAERQLATWLEEAGIPYLLAVNSEHQAHLMFELSARDYVLMKMPDDHIESALIRFLKSLVPDQSPHAAGSPASSVTQPNAIWVRTGHAERKVLHSAIRSISADKDYAIIELDDTSLLVRATMSSLEAELPDSEFIRIHRSHIVSADDIREVRTLGPNRHQIRLKNGRVFPVGRTYWPRIRAMLRRQNRPSGAQLLTG